MSRRSGSPLSIAQVLHGIEDKAATQKDSAIDKFFCSKFERTAEIRYNLVYKKVAIYCVVADPKTALPIPTRHYGSLRKKHFYSL